MLLNSREESDSGLFHRLGKSASFIGLMGSNPISSANFVEKHGIKLIEMTINTLLRPQIYGFAFSGISTILYKLHEVDSCYLVFGESSINKYLDFLIHDQPTFILGLGVYSGVDQDKIRIETICTNQFRNDYLDTDGLLINQIPSFIVANESTKLSRGIGNSWWQVPYKLNKKSLIKSEDE